MHSHIFKFVLVVSLILLNSCEKIKTEKNKDTIKTSVDVLQTKDTIINSKNRYYLYITDKYPKILDNGNKLIYYKEKDLDLDGHTEIVMGFGTSERNLKIKRLGSFFVIRDLYKSKRALRVAYDYTFRNSIGYYKNDIKIISLQGKKQSYIYLGVTGKDSFQGFMLLELNDDDIVRDFFYCGLEGIGFGNNKLVDKNNDGQYDGYVQINAFREYVVTTNFVYKNNLFKKSNVAVQIPDYPNNISGVLMQYISLRSLDFGESAEVNQRLKQLYPSDQINNIEWNKEVWKMAYSYYSDSNKTIKFDVKKENGKITAIATCIDSEKQKHQLKFELQKNKGKWQIIKLNAPNN